MHWSTFIENFSLRIVVIRLSPVTLSTRFTFTTFSNSSLKMPLSRAEREQIYQRYLEREGPQQLGTRDWPAPSESALAGERFVVTGVMETIERDDLKGIIAGSSGRVMTQMPKKLDYLVAGRDAGPVKLEKAQQQGVPVLNEDQFHGYLLGKMSKR